MGLVRATTEKSSKSIVDKRRNKQKQNAQITKDRQHLEEKQR